MPAVIPFIPAIVGGAASMYGAHKQGKAQEAAMNRVGGTDLGTVDFFGPGGAYSRSTGGGVDPVTGETIAPSMTSRLGGMGEPTMQEYMSGANLGAISGRQALARGVPSDVLNFNDRLNNQNLDLGAFMTGQQGAGMLGARSLMDAFGGASQPQLLNNMRAQAAPQEQLAMRQFVQGLYGSGRGAVTGASGNESSVGGGRLAAAFGEGMGRTDLTRQLQSYGLSDSLMNSAFGRFGNMAELGANLNSQSFARQRGVLNEGYARAASMPALPASIASAFFGASQGARGGFMDLGRYGMDIGRLALDQNIAGANARNSAGTNIANIMGGDNYSASPMADAFGDIAGGAMQNVDWGNMWKGGTGKPIIPPQDWSNNIPGTDIGYS